MCQQPWLLRRPHAFSEIPLGWNNSISSTAPRALQQPLRRSKRGETFPAYLGAALRARTKGLLLDKGEGAGL